MDAQFSESNWQGAGWQTDTFQPESRIRDFQTDFSQSDGNRSRLSQQWSNEPEMDSFETRGQDSGFRGGMQWEGDNYGKGPSPQMRGGRGRGRGFDYRNQTDNSGRGGYHQPQDQHYDENSYQTHHSKSNYQYHPLPGEAHFESQAQGRDDGYGRGWSDPGELHSHNMEYHHQGNAPSGPGQHFDRGRGQKFSRGRGRPYRNRHTHTATSATASQGSYASNKEPNQGQGQTYNRGPDQMSNKRANQSTSKEPCDKTSATKTDSSKGEERIEINQDKSEFSQYVKPAETTTESQKVSGEPLQQQDKAQAAFGQQEPGGVVNARITGPHGPGIENVNHPAHSSAAQTGEPVKRQAAETESMSPKQQPSEDKPESTVPVPDTSTATAIDMEESDDEGDDTSFCKLCSMSFDSNEKYFRHTRGLLHTQRRMANEEQKKSSIKAGQSDPNYNTQDQPQTGTDRAKQPSSQQPGQQHRNMPYRQGLQFDARGQEQPECGGPLQYGRDAWHQTQSSQFGRDRPEARAGGTGGNWPKGQGGEQQSKDEGNGKENLKENNDPFVAGGRGSDVASPVQKCHAATTSQGLALISGDGDDEEDLEDEEDWEEEEMSKGAADKEQIEEIHCDLCDIQTTGFISMRAHLNGRIHKTVQENLDKGTPVPVRLLVKLGPKAQIYKPTVPVTDVKPNHEERPSILMELLKAIPEAVVGVKCVREFQIGRQPSFLCTVCESTCDSASIQTHLLGSKHRMKYLKEYNPDVYEHVKKHGGKKSQLSAFLEEVCTDIEKREGRGKPKVEQPITEPGAEKSDQKKSLKPKEKPKSKQKTEEKSTKSEGASDSGKETGSEAKPDPSKRSLPHEVVVAMYKESKKRQEEVDQEEDPQEDYRHGKEWPNEGYGRVRGEPPEDYIYRRGGPPQGFRRGRGGPPDYFGRGRGGPPDHFGHGRGGPTDYPGRGRGGPLDYPGRGRGGPPDYPGGGRRPPPEDFWYGREGPLDDFERRRGWYPEDMKHGGGWPPEDCEHGRRHPAVDNYECERGGPMDPYKRLRDSDYRPEFRESGDDRYLPPSFRDPRSVEEERQLMMYEYEKHNFYYPPIGISSHEARRLMFVEYERLGLPYEQACDRVLIQEERRVNLMELLRDGIPLAEAQQKVLASENRRVLIREYEEQGLSPTEAQWRVIVEEERKKLFEDYERRGFTPLEARAHISCGQHRSHLIHEYERHGIPPDEARRRALAEEDHFKAVESGSLSSRHTELDSIAEKRMLRTHLEQGMSQEDAENKVIAYLRQQGVTTQDAILRVKKIQLEVPVKSSRGEVEDSRRDERIDSGSSSYVSASRDVGRGVTTPDTTPVLEEQRSSGRDSKPSSSSRVDRPAKYEHISPEEAKEKLLREYEKRGIPREEARSALIAELIRSGVPEGEARRRFAEPSASTSKKPKEDNHNSRRGGWRGGHEFSLSSSPSSRDRRSRSPIPRAYRTDREMEVRTRDDRDRGREDRTWGGRDRVDSRDRRRGSDRRDETTAESSSRGHYAYSEDRGRSRRGGSIEIVSKDDSRYLESLARPTLTLGEELRLKKLKRSGGIELLGQSPAKQAKQTAATSASTSTSSRTAAATTARVKPEMSSSEETKQDVSGLLESLTNNLISSEDDAAMALQVSKALTSALLKYQLKTVPDDEVEQPASQSQSSFVERRIEDAKKLFETKMQTKGSPQSPSKQGHPGDRGSKATEALQTQEGRIRFGFFAPRSQPAKNTIPQGRSSQQRTESVKWMREAVFPDEEEEDLEEGKNHRSSGQGIERDSRNRKIFLPGFQSAKGRPSSSRRDY